MVFVGNFHQLRHRINHLTGCSGRVAGELCDFFDQVFFLFKGFIYSWGVGKRTVEGVG
jgi:hypothetical protein